MKPIKTFDDVINKRRSIRSFTNEFPSQELINKIIQAGILAPYAGATGIPLNQIRKFFIISAKSESMPMIKRLLLNQIQKNSRKLKIILSLFPFLRKKMGSFSNRLEQFSRNGIPSLEEAPYYIIIAEKKGFPPIEKQSMAHALQNMWLMATSLGVGFQLLSATGTMSKNREFLKILGINKGEYEIDGCLIGYPKNYPSEKTVHVNEYAVWI
jgi:nitroreductase